MKIAFYRAKYGNWVDKAVQIITFGPFSHCELVFSDGQWFSSSWMDGGVRYKKITENEHWEFIPINIWPQDEAIVRKWCDTQVGLCYDILGLLCPLVAHNNRWWCSEIVTVALQRVRLLMYVNPARSSPNSLYRNLKW